MLYKKVVPFSYVVVKTHNYTSRLIFGILVGLGNTECF